MTIKRRKVIEFDRPMVIHRFCECPLAVFDEFKVCQCGRLALARSIKTAWQILLLKFVDITKFQEFLKFIKFEFSIYDKKNIHDISSTCWLIDLMMEPALYWPRTWRWVHNQGGLSDSMVLL